MANVLIQNWNACTYVIPRMPPLATIPATTPPTHTTPTQYGAPTACTSVSPAPLSCGTR